MNSYLDIIIRSVCVYGFVLIAIRLAGKKELSQLSVADLVLIMLVSNAVQNAMVGDNVSLAGGLVAAAVLFLVDLILKYTAFRSKRFRNLLEGKPVLLVYKGVVHIENLQREKLTIEELNAAVREHGVADTSDVELAMLETDGNISVLSKPLEHQQTMHTSKRKLHHKFKRQ
jgi:uncharacterized membrane protein YcaP (DUF421 family)